MNYRQWKKNYKKRHGHNPPLEADKRQRAKAMRNTITANDIVTAIAEFYRGLSNGFRAAADAAQNVAERIEKGAANDSNRDI
jgi:hypothetical protein